MTPIRLFISSVQRELATERAVLRDWLRSDPLMRRFFDPFLFEDAPAADQRADELYLEEVERCDLYVGVFGNDYGFEDAQGVSPTEREFDHATALHKTRLIFVKGADDKVRHPKMRALVHKAGDQLVRRRFGSTVELIAEVHAALVQYLEERGFVQDTPFDDRVHEKASLEDLDPEAVRLFVRRARQKRQFPLPESASLQEVLTRLKLWREERLTNGALLLFGRDPQRYFPATEVRCMHFHGASVQRPAPFYRIFQGSLFTLVDQAVDFVLSKIDYRVGTRAFSNEAPSEHEVPPEIVREAIVNAVAHRDYTQPAAIQVSVFADRIEVRNPGGLLPPLTPESLGQTHSSVLRNQRLAEALYLVGYIEKYGTGTLMMIREARAHSLPAPEFEVPPGEFVAVVWRDWLTPALMAQLGLNERQRAAMTLLHLRAEMTNSEYQQATGAARATAKRDLEELVQLGLLERVGAGRGAHYVLTRKRLKNGSIGSFAGSAGIGSETAQSAQRAGRPLCMPRKPGKPS